MNKKEEQEKQFLQKIIMKLREEIDSETSQRAYFQLERSKLESFWSISKTELEKLLSDYRHKERNFEEILERHEVEIKVFKQKLRHLHYEQKTSLDRLKIENENHLKLQSEEFHQKHQGLKSDLFELKEFLKEQELSQSEHLKEIKLDHEKRITESRQSFELELKQIQIKYRQKMEQVREDLEEETKQCVDEIERSKNLQIEQLMKEHERSFDNIKKFFKQITKNNLSKIEQLNKDVNQMKQTEAKHEETMFEIAQANNDLSQPLMKHLSDVNRLRQELSYYNRDRRLLESKEKRLKREQEKLKKMNWNYEILFQSFQELDKEKNKLKNNYQKKVHQIQQKTLFKNQLLETKAAAIQEKIHLKEIQLNEVIKHSNLDEDAIENLKKNIFNEDDDEEERGNINNNNNTDEQRPPHEEEEEDDEGDGLMDNNDNNNIGEEENEKEGESGFIV